MQADPLQPPAAQHRGQRVAALVGDRDRIPRHAPCAGGQHDQHCDGAAHRYHPDGRNRLRPAYAIPQFVHPPEYRHTGKGKRLQGTR